MMKNSKTTGSRGAPKARSRRAPKKAKRDPRTTPAPTAPASVSEGALNAVAGAAEAATAEPRSAAEAASPTPRPTKSASRAAKPAAKQSAVPFSAAIETGTERARRTGETLRHAAAQSVTVATKGVAEINGKVLDLMRAQSEAALTIWGATLTAGSFAEAITTQSRSVRQACEATAAHWREIAETTTRLIGDAAKPLHSAWAGAAR
jgi:hypothetical protein